MQNLDKSIDNKALHDTFSAFGKILSCKVATDANGQSKGYGFVHFETDAAAQIAIDKVDGMMIEDKIVYVGPFQKRGDRPAGKEVFNNVYIKNLTDVTDEDLVKMVSEYGEVTSAVMMKVRPHGCVAGEHPWLRGCMGRMACAERAACGLRVMHPASKLSGRGWPGQLGTQGAA